MAVEIISTSAWTSGDITVPSDCTAVYMFYAHLITDEQTLDSVTLESVSPDQIFKLPCAYSGGWVSGTGVAVWYNPGTGSGRSPSLSWGGSNAEGPVVLFVFVKGGNTTAWRDADGAGAVGSGSVSVTIDSNATDLVLKFDQRYDSLPGTSTGWTSEATLSNNYETARLSSADSPGAATTVCDSENEYYSTICAVSIPAAAGGVSIPVLMRYYRNRRT